MRETSSDMEEMSKWHPEEQGKGRMTEDKAHGEANMMRAKLEVNPSSGAIRDKKREPRTYGEAMEADLHGGLEREVTKDDYDRALQAIGEIKASAVEQPQSEKTILKIKRFMENFGHVLDTATDSVVLNARGLAKTRVHHENTMAELLDAEQRLKIMQKSGEKFGESEARYGKTTQELKRSKAA
jgi:hypothetical protein